MNNQNEAANKILSVTDHQTIDSLWEISSHGTKRTDVELAYLSGYQAALTSQAQQEPNKDVHEAIILLSAVFDAWENGTDCYDDFDGVSGSFIGKAFNLDEEVFKRCCDLLNRVNPPRNISQAQQPTKLVFDSESARQFLLENVLPKFSDSTFQKYVLEELAGDFAYQLVMYLQSQAQHTESQWISVDEQLPEGYKPVLVATNFGDVYTCRLPVIIAKNSKEESSVGKRERFTHWMPLPPAPEGGDK